MDSRVSVGLVLAEYVFYIRTNPFPSRQLLFDEVGVDDPSMWPFDIERYVNANQRIRAFLRRGGGAA